jgi:hypothetical protein
MSASTHQSIRDVGLKFIDRFHPSLFPSFYIFITAPTYVAAYSPSSIVFLSHCKGLGENTLFISCLTLAFWGAFLASYSHAGGVGGSVFKFISSCLLRMPVYTAYIIPVYTLQAHPFYIQLYLFTRCFHWGNSLIYQRLRDAYSGWHGIIWLGWGWRIALEH